MSSQALPHDCSCLAYEPEFSFVPSALIGGSGAGKTTLGRELARRIGGVFVEVDAIQHKRHWVKAGVQAIRVGLHEVLEGRPKWVVDGTCERKVGDFIANRADMIVWLDLPLAVKLGRLLRRSWIRVRTSETLWNGNVESWHGVFIGLDAVLVHPLRTHFRRRRQILARCDYEKVVRLRSASSVNQWLLRFPRKDGRTPGSKLQESSS